jgi:flagellin
MQSINTNFAGLVAQRNLSKSSASLTTSIERLSSGLRINSAKDDAAGLAIAERMNSQIRGQEVAKRTANDGISLLQVADGALGTVSDNLQRMRDLAVQSQNGTLSPDDRINLDTEYQALSKEIERVGTNTKFNDNAVFSATAVDVQIGANTTADNKLSVTIGALATVAGDLKTAAAGATAIGAIDTKLKEVTTTRSNLGANINRIDSAISNLDTNTTNLSTARGRIVDADFAKESAALTRTQILQQAGTSMLSQANQIPQGVLSLLGR